MIAAIPSAHPLHDCASRSRVTQSSVLSSARDSRSNSSSISAALMISGGRQRQNVAQHRANDQAFGFAELHGARRDTMLRGRTHACFFCRRRVPAPPIRPSPRASPTSGCSPSALSRAWNCGAAFGGFLDDAVARVNLDRLQRDRGGNRMAAIGEAVAEHADLFAFDEQRLVHRFGNHDAGDRQIGRRQAPWRPRSNAARN